MTSRRCDGAYRKEGKNGKCRNWRAWFCALWAGCQNASAFSTGGQIDNFEVCHAPETHLCFPDYTTIWDHKIIKKHMFVSEWKASIKAIDLAFEMGCSTQDNAWTFVKPPRCNRSRRHIRFNTAVDFHAGPEDDAELTRWHHALEVPYHRASLFHNEWESDQVSFMARHDPGLILDYLQYMNAQNSHIVWIKERLLNKKRMNSSMCSWMQHQKVQFLRILGHQIRQFEVAGEPL